MTKFELDKILKDASRLGFIEAIELIKFNEPAYKKSDFFKIHKIPLLQLYKEYFMWDKAQRDLVLEFSEYVKNFDYQLIIDKLLEFLKEINENPEIMEKIEGLVEKFDPKALDGMMDGLQREIAKLKK